MTFASSGQFGPFAFERAWHALPIPSTHRVAAVARWLDVTESTVRAWVSGRRCPPRAVVYALWLESAEGRQMVQNDLFNEARTHAAHARSLQDVTVRQQAAIAALHADLSAAKQAAPGRRCAANDADDTMPKPQFPAFDTPACNRRGRRPASQRV